MLRSNAVGLAMALAAAFYPAAGPQNANQDMRPSVHSFLQKAAEGQQAEIALGQLASERAGNELVKQFGTQMMEDHEKASRDIRELATKEGIQLPTQLDGRHQDKKDRFARLSGREFDQAYMTHMLRDHRRDVKEFEQDVQTLKDPQLQQWVKTRIPILKQHLQNAKRIAASIGIKSPLERKTE